MESHCESTGDRADRKPLSVYKEDPSFRLRSLTEEGRWSAVKVWWLAMGAEKIKQGKRGKGQRSKHYSQWSGPKMVSSRGWEHLWIQEETEACIESLSLDAKNAEFWDSKFYHAVSPTPTSLHAPFLPLVHQSLGDCLDALDFSSTQTPPLS